MQKSNGDGVAMWRSVGPLLLALTALAACGTPQETPDREPLTSVVLQLKWKHQFQFAGYYAAIEQGFYQDAGFEVTLMEAEDGVEPAASVLNGEAHFGIATSDLALMRADGAPVVVLAPIFQHSPITLLVSQASGVESVHELPGKPIMMEPHAAELLAYLQNEGLPADRLNTVPHTYTPDALIQGRVAAMSAYSTDEPFLLDEAGVEHLAFQPRAGGVDFYGDTLFTTETLVASHPERVKAFLAASLRGWEYALAHSEELIDVILQKYSPRHSREHLLFEAKETARLIVPDVVPVGYVNPGRWDHIANTYRELGMMEGDLSHDGFLFQREAPPIPPDLTLLYVALGIALFLVAVFSAVTLRTRHLNAKIREQAASLQRALDEIKELRGILSICSHCNRIHDGGSWHRIEKYLTEHTNATFSHGICADCIAEHYPEALEDEAS